MIFETHAHYDDKAFADDREEVIASLKDENITRVVNVGDRVETSRYSVEIAKENDFIYAAVGIHPSEVCDVTEESIKDIKELALNNKDKVVAIGEIGLDYHWPEPEREIQKKWFKKQLQLAKDLDLPIIIHSRDAAEDTYDILKEYADELSKRDRKQDERDALDRKILGVIHCYSYTPEMARRFVDLGFYIGIGGVITFKNARKLKETAVEIPLDRIVLETDSPYIAPEPNRGRRNDSRNLKYVVKALADLKEVTEEEIEKVTFKNACELYRLGK